MTLLGACKLNYMFITEVMLKCGDLHYFQRCFSYFVVSIYQHEPDRILEIPLNIMQSRTTPPLTYKLNLHISNNDTKILNFVNN